MSTEARAVGFLLLSIATVGCSAPQVSAPTPEPTAVARPSVPDGWSTITSDEGDVELAIPADFVVMLTMGSVVAQPPIVEQAAGPGLEVWATGPAQIEQPKGGESVGAWLARGSWLPEAGEGGITALADRTERQLILPAGRAVEVAVTAQPGTADESRVVVYAIETSDGVAILRLIGFPPHRLDERADDLAMLVTLARFGADVGD